jgi:hypothetical protein
MHLLGNPSSGMTKLAPPSVCAGVTSEKPRPFLHLAGRQIGIWHLIVNDGTERRSTVFFFLS